MQESEDAPIRICEACSGGSAPKEVEPSRCGRAQDVQQCVIVSMLAGKVEVTADDTQSVFCKACSGVIRGSEPFVSHCSGQRHRKALRMQVDLATFNERDHAVDKEQAQRADYERACAAYSAWTSTSGSGSGSGDADRPCSWDSEEAFLLYFHMRYTARRRLRELARGRIVWSGQLSGVAGQDTA